MIGLWRKWGRVVLLGILTIGSYGIAMYGYGVLIGPIHDDTGWSISWLSSTYTLSLLIGGAGALLSGWTLDRFGARPVLLGTLVVGSAFLLAAASAQSLVVFVVGWGVGAGVIAAGLFYNVTMALTTRLFQAERVRAFAILTFTGGLASVIYFPLAGILVEWLEWRLALRVMVVLLGLHVLPAALLVSGGAARKEGGAPSSGRTEYGSMMEAFRSREVLKMIAMFSMAAMAFAAIQVHHVPAMTAAGLSLSAATMVASVRGFLSLPGRALMEPVVRRMGVGRAMGLAYMGMALGTLPLAIGGSVVFALMFMVSTGLVFGAISPLQGLYASEVYGERRIGTLMGMQSLMVSLVAATGPMVLGLTVDLTGGYAVAILLACALFGAAFGLLRLSAGETRAATAPEPTSTASPG